MVIRKKFYNRRGAVFSGGLGMLQEKAPGGTGATTPEYCQINLA